MRTKQVASLVVALGLVVTVAACGGEDDGAVGDGGWAFTDDRGKTVTLDEMPARIAGYSDEVSALWNFGIEPVAAFGYLPLAEDVQFAGKDLGAVEEVGTSYGEIDLEALAAAEPDLIVTTSYPQTDDVLYGFADDQQLEAVEEIAPVVAIAQQGSAEDVIARNADLATALGADLRSPRLAAASAEFDAASQALATAGEKGLRVIVVAAYEGEGIYVAKPPDDPALSYYRSLGVDFVAIGGDEFYWEVLSWENADRYPADIILYSLRAMSPTELGEQPTFAALPATRAGQLYPWKFVGLDYDSQAAYMRELAGWLDAASPVAS
jgi:iron complex transport system substrate-binding protein